MRCSTCIAVLSFLAHLVLGAIRVENKATGGGEATSPVPKLPKQRLFTKWFVGTAYRDYLALLQHQLHQVSDRVDAVDRAVTGRVEKLSELITTMQGDRSKEEELHAVNEYTIRFDQMHKLYDQIEAWCTHTDGHIDDMWNAQNEILLSMPLPLYPQLTLNRPPKKRKKCFPFGM